VPTRELSPGGGKTGKPTTLNKAYCLCSSILLEWDSRKLSGQQKSWGLTAPALAQRDCPLLLQSLLQLLSELSVLVAPILEVLQRSYFRFDYPPERYALQTRV
jgi:hypothetical protein